MPTTKTPEKESLWKKNMNYIRDAVFIIMFLISTAGWIRSEAIKKTKLETQVETLTKTLDDNTRQLEKINDILSQQNTLNGKIILYMQMKK